MTRARLVHATAAAPFVALALFGAAGCARDTTAPSPAGNYTLAAYAGQSLPVVVRTIVTVSPTPGSPADYTCDDQLVAMRLVLSPGGAFTRNAEHRFVCDDPQRNESFAVAEGGRYTAAGQQVRLTFEEQGDHHVEDARRADGALTIYRAEYRAGDLTTISTTELRFARE